MRYLRRPWAQRLILLLLVLTATLAAVHLHTPREATTARPACVMIVLDPSLEQYAADWKVEIARRFPNSVAVFVHGNEFLPGLWFSATPMGPMDAREVMLGAMKRYPDRTPVLLSCNPGHLKLGIPGVYYAPSSAWLIPDRAVHDLEDITASLRMDSPLPTTVPSTQPAEPSGFNPFDFPLHLLFEKPAPQVYTKNRWETDPDVVGNIFEFKTDDEQ